MMAVKSLGYKYAPINIARRCHRRGECSYVLMCSACSSLIALGIITKITWGSKYVGGLLALLPFRSTILEPDLHVEYINTEYADNN